MAVTTATPTSPAKAAWIGLFLGPLLLLLCLLTPAPEGMSDAAWATVGMTLLMAIWWATEAIPIPATSLLPIVLIPALGIGNVGSATSPYANPTIFLFLGGFVIGLAMERWNLHRRIALNILLAVGNKPSLQIAGFMAATAFLSMWVSNTATAIMMLPIGLSVINMLAGEGTPEKERERFSTALLLAIAYASSLGGIATLIGTPPNALLAGFLSDNYNVELGFGKWMLLGVPVAATMLLLTWWWLTRRGFNLSGHDSSAMMRQELASLGPMGRGEILVTIVFVCAALSWIFQPLIAKVIPGANDTTIAIAAAMALFIIPADLKSRTFLMNWESAGKLPWGVLLLFGGGLSLAAVIRTTGLAEWIASNMGFLGTLPGIAMIALVVMTINFLTEITSNTATAATFLPLMGALAVANGLPPELLAIPTAIAASCAFMMPVATPPNAIVFGTGHMKIQSMIKTGFFLTVTGIVVTTLLCYFLIGLIWVQ